MSNKKPNKKILPIKRITTTPAEDQPSIMSIQEKLDDEISVRKQKIAHLTTQHETLMTDLKASIAKEKEAWQQTKETEREEARKLGYQIGYDEAEDAVRQQYEQMIQQANELVEAAQTNYYKTIQQHELAIAQLSIQVAEKIISQTIHEEPEAFIGLVKQAITALKEKSDIAIYVHPDHYLFVQDQQEELEQMIDEGESLSIYMDTQLKKDDCVIKYPFGQIEAGVDVQLKQIKNALEEKLTEND